MTARWIRASVMAMTTSAMLFLSWFQLEQTVATAGLQKKAAPLAAFTVNSTGDQSDLSPGDGVCLTANGDCTLRAAIEEANALAGADTINFNLGTGTPAITPASALPSITGSLTIDGNTGGATRGQITGSGIATAGTHGLMLAAGSSGSAIRALVIQQWTGNGLFIQSNNNVVENCYIGTDITGTLDIGAGGDGVRINSGPDNNTIGGSTATPGAAPGNVISGNNTYGIDADNANDDSVQGNLIGLKANGADALPNSSHGVFIHNTSVRIAIGGTASGAANTIAFNGGDGVNVAGSSSNGNSIRANSIYSNTGLGIDLAGGSENASGVTANDANDSDSGANTLQNYPVITTATVSGGSTTVSGTLNSAANTTFAIDFIQCPRLTLRATAKAPAIAVRLL